ncbi:reverse transcriptase domain-containing protein [Tanacetum coccineum]|uniref:Reverse transcriptase domain-containing protein n=1 Tax=Tanacetum coccineum TaxID=301880 RepID=A0ABQ4X076_9ASTR
MIQKESIQIESLKSSTQHSTVNDFVVINIPEEDVETKKIILDPDDRPMWESAKTVALTPNSSIVQIDVDDNFVINSTHLKMIWENKFDGYLWADPHDHICEFLTIYDMFKYGKTQSEPVKILIFPFSLCNDAKTSFNELKEESIRSWEQMRRDFINKFFPPSLFNRLLLEIRSFSQDVCLKCDLLLDDLIVDNGYTKHMTGNKRLFTLYKVYDGGYVVFGSNLKGKVVGGGNITHDSISFTNVEHVSDLAFNLISVVINHSSEFNKLQFESFCEQHGMSYNLLGPFTSQSSEIVERTHRKLRKMSRAMLAEQSIPQKFWFHALDMATYIFNKSYPEPKLSSSVEDDRIIKPIVQNPVRSPSLETNASEPGYPKNLKEARGHPI